MTNILSSIMVAIITSVLTVLGILYVQKRKNESSIRKSALYLYLNLKQTKSDIDEDKKAIDITGEIMPMTYFSSFDYIQVLSELKDKLSEQEIMIINNFYEHVKKIDSNKMYFFNIRKSYNDFTTINPTLLNPYEKSFFDNYNIFKRDLNNITNSDEYKTKIVEIISNLQKIYQK